MREVRIPRASDVLFFNSAGNHYKHLVLLKILILIAVKSIKKPDKALGCLTTGLILSKILIVSNVYLVYVRMIPGSGQESKTRKKYKKHEKSIFS